MTPDDLEAQLRDLARASLPPDLKRRVIAGAVFAEAPDWRDRLWFSRAWRLAGAAMVLVLLAADRWAIPLGDPRAGDGAAKAEAQVAAIADAAGVPADQARRLLSRVEVVPITAPAPADPGGAGATDVP